MCLKQIVFSSVKHIFIKQAKANYVHQHFSSNLPYGVTYLYCGTDKPTKRQNVEGEIDIREEKLHVQISIKR